MDSSLKKIIIKTPQQFYTLIKNKEIDKSLLPFYDRIELFLYGCPCESESYWMQTISEYRKISRCDLECLKLELECDLIEFYLDDKPLFTL